MNRSLKYLVAPVALAVGLTACDVPEPVASGKTLAEVLTSDTGDNAEGFDTNWDDFDIVTEAVLLFEDFTDAVSDPDADLTVMLPTDAAFRDLVTDLTGSVPASEDAAFATVASLGLETVGDVLAYHIVGARLAASDVLASDGANVTTLLGESFKVNVVRPDLALVRLDDLDPTDADGGPIFNYYNLGGEHLNGFAHGVSAVLRPADL